MLLRFVLGVVLLFAAIALLGMAGGIDLMSAADWQNIAQKWALPAKGDDKSLYLLLLGTVVSMLAIARLLTPHRPRV